MWSKEDKKGCRSEGGRRRNQGNTSNKCPKPKGPGRDENLGFKSKDYPSGTRRWNKIALNSEIGHIHEIPQRHKGVVNGIKSGSDNSFTLYSAAKINTGLSRKAWKTMGYWASSKSTRLRCVWYWSCGSYSPPSAVTLVLSADGTGGALGVQAASPRFCCFSSLFLTHHCQHVAFLPAGGFLASGTHSPEFSQPLKRRPHSNRHRHPSKWLPSKFPQHPACHFKLWHFRQISLPREPHHTVFWISALGEEGKGSFKSLILPQGLSQSTSSGCSLHLLFRDSLEISAPLSG